MIDLTTETILTLNEAAKRLPPVSSKRVHLSTIWRWARVGIGGTKLEYVRVGKRICTSVEALNRFANALAEADRVPGLSRRPPDRKRPQTAKQRQRDFDRAEAELKAAGF